MKRYKLALLLSCVATVATVAVAKPVVNVTEGTKGGLARTITESWVMTDDEKKNYATPTMMSGITTLAIAPTQRLKRNDWQFIYAENKACFYNTYGIPVSARFSMSLTVLGNTVNIFDSVVVAGGQALCVTNYPQMWINPKRGIIPTQAATHAEMDGQGSDNQGNGQLDVR
jgi:hypothetical protein